MVQLLARQFNEKPEHIVIKAGDLTVGARKGDPAGVSIQTLRFHPECTYNIVTEDQTLSEPLVSAEESEEESNDEDRVPSDISESDLLEMLTECMAVKLLKNKDSEILNVMRQLRPEDSSDHRQTAAQRKQRKRDRKREEKLTEPIMSGEESDELKNGLQDPVRTNPYFFRLRRRVPAPV